MKIKSSITNVDIKKEKKNAIFLLSFLLPLILMVAMLISKHVFPFGDKCILRTDFYHQYLPFHSELSDKLKHFSSLFYTTRVGLGTNFITVMAYYLICPLNILLFIVGDNFVLEYITFALVFKIAFAGLTMAYYLVKKYDTDSFAVIFFAMFYAMSGYICAYYWNVMWIDDIILFPLLIHAFEALYNGKKPYLYIILLAAVLLCNYYIGIIICIYLVVHFVFYSFIRETKIKAVLKKLLLIGIYSLIGILISGILLWPVICAFKTTASSDISAPEKVRQYFSIIEGIARTLPFVKVENGIDYWPNIYVGSICYILLPLYFLSKKYKLREKICYGILLLFFIASFSINILDFVWHIFKFPNSLPCRQSFIFNFIVLSISLKPLLKIKSIKRNHVVYAALISLAVFIIASKEIINNYVGFYSIYMAIILIFVYMGILLAYKNDRYDKNIILYITIILISFEAFINMYQTSLSTITREDYMKNTKTIKKLTSDLNNITDDIYRVERAVLKTKNDGAFMHFPSASIFSSSAYAHGTSFYKTFGMEASTNAYSMTGSTPFADSLLSVKYKLYEKENEHAKDENKRLISKEDAVHIYQNLDTLPFSYVLDDKFIEDYDRSSGNPATVQNNFSRTLKLGTMLEKMTVDIDGKEASFKVEDAGDYYAFVRDKGIKEVTVTYPTTSESFKNLNRGYFLELGYLDKGVDLGFRNETNEDELLIEVFRFDFEALKKVVDKINSNFTYKIKSHDESHFNYDMKANIDGTCMVTLPYDKGFKIYVDGEKVETKEVFDFFLGFDIKKGDHDIVLKFTPIGFYEGVLMSLIGIIILIGLYIIKEKSIKKSD